MDWKVLFCVHISSSLFLLSVFFLTWTSIPFLLSLAGLVFLCQWLIGWTRAARDPCKQSSLWHSHHWRSALSCSLIYSSFFYALYYCHFYLLSAAASLMYPSSVVLAWSLMFTLISLHNVFSIWSFASDSEWTVLWWLVFSRVSHIIGTHCKATQTAVLTSDAAIHRPHT